MEYIAETQHNPFDVTPPCDQYVPGFGDPNAHFHVIGDHPGVHGGLSTGVPFTDRAWSETFFDALQRGGLVQSFDPSSDVIDSRGTFFSYLCLCETDGRPTAEEYAAMEPYFDAELRAITAHVLLPVGECATTHVLKSYTARAVDGDLDLEHFHADDIHGSGWLVVPIKEPAEWDEEDGDRLAETLADLLDSDYRQISDLGRFQPDSDPYFVR